MKFKAAILLATVVLFVPRSGIAGGNSAQDSSVQFRHRLLVSSGVVFCSRGAVSERSLFDRCTGGRNFPSTMSDIQSSFGVARSVGVDLREATKQERKSIFLAVLYSLVLPGMGELFSGRFDVGKYPLITEAVLWLTYTGFQLYGNWLQDDARSFAVVHAGISPAGKDDQFYVNVSNFLNTYDYDDKKLRDRDLGLVYDDQSHFWQWDSDANRARFRDLRVSADNLFNNSRFVIAAVIVNHIVSAINAARLTSRYNSDLGSQTSSFEIRASVLGGLTHPDGIAITLQKSLW